MLRRFETIIHCGIFENFTWDASVPDFERINLVYGANGVGKTSLARALDDLGGSNEGYRRVSIRMGGPSNSSRASNYQHAPEFDRIFVFSDRYVARSHNFKDDTEIEAVITLGERTVDDEKQLAELRTLIGSEAKDLADAESSAASVDGQLENEYARVADSIVNSLRRAGGRYRSRGSYSSRAVKRAFQEGHDSWTLLPEPELAADLATVNSDTRDEVQVKACSFSVRNELRTEALGLIATSPVTTVLDTLQQNPDATSWTEQGRDLHDGLNQCIFCGNLLTEERKHQIEQHFSHEVEQLQESLDLLIEEIDGIRESLGELLGDGAIAGALYDDFRESFNEGFAQVEAQKSELRVWLTGVRGALQAKRENVIATVEHGIQEPPAVDGAKVEAALKGHNERVARHASLMQEAAARVERHLLKETEARVDELAKEAKEIEHRRASLEEDLKRHRNATAALENVQGDPLPSAAAMSRELSRILGRNELGFELLPDGKHYRVTRHGGPARDLSTGERTAITLIHFLEHVKQMAAKGGKPIVVIDDPVSSLDSGSATGISTYIWSEAVSKDHIEQIFLLTHNFELFRQWDIQIEGLPRKNGSPDPKFSSNRYELIALHRHSNGKIKRFPKFVAWEPNSNIRKKIRSAYHHAFITAVQAHRELVADDSIEKKLDALLLYPNMLRRMLETFLAFKNPASVGNFTSAMRKISDTLEDQGYPGDADALRLQLTRFTHASSHAESPETDVAANPDEIKVIITAVFTFMHAIDKTHFDGLCKIVGVDPSDLLLGPLLPDASA